MEKIIIDDIKQITINKDGIIIIQNDGGIVELTKEQINSIGVDNYEKK